MTSIDISHTHASYSASCLSQNHHQHVYYYCYYKHDSWSLVTIWQIIMQYDFLSMLDCPFTIQFPIYGQLLVKYHKFLVVTCRFYDVHNKGIPVGILPLLCSLTGLAYSRPQSPSHKTDCIYVCSFESCCHRDIGWILQRGTVAANNV